MKSIRLAAFALLAFAWTLTATAQDKPQHSAVKPEPRDGNWMKRHESFNARVAKGNVDLIFIGDSITQGWEGAGKKAWETQGLRDAPEPVERRPAHAASARSIRRLIRSSSPSMQPA